MRYVSLLLLLTQGCFFTTVPGGSVGVVAEFGEIQPRTLAEGLNWIVPYRDEVQNMSCRIRKREATASASSRDMQQVKTQIVLNYRIDCTKAVDIFRGIGSVEAVESTIIDPALQEAVKRATAQFTADELITKRADVKNAITVGITRTATKSHVLVTELSITDFEFDQNYQAAIEAKQVAEQRALTAKNDLSRIKVEAQQAEAAAEGKARAALIAAESEAKAQELIRQTITREIVALRAIEKWNGELPSVMDEGGLRMFQAPSR